VEGLYEERSEEIDLTKEGALLGLLKRLLEHRNALQKTAKAMIKPPKERYRAGKASFPKCRRSLAIQAQINAAVGNTLSILSFTD
jgi:hypothetical protein